MRNILLPTLLIAIAMVSQSVQAQTDVSLDPEVGGRMSFCLDKKLARGLHISLEEEIRLDNNFTDFDRLQTTLGISYKMHTNIKIGLGYAFIAPYSSSTASFRSTRHRLMFDLTGTLHFNLWNVSLKERLQFTHRAGDFNSYQNPTNTLGLKSRITVKYKGWQYRGYTPYAYLELRTTFSGPTVKAHFLGEEYLPQYSTTGQVGDTVGEAGWFLGGFNSTYINRLRTCVGVDYRLSRASTLSFFLLADRIRNKAIDANKKGTKLFTYTDETGFVFSLGAGYTYAF